METIWIRWFALVAILALSPYTSLTEAPRLKSPISLLVAPANVAASTSTSRNTQEKSIEILTIKRNKMTTEGSRIGVMAYEGKTICYTLENERVKIPSGTYKAELRWSEHFQRIVPYIHVPSRSGIEIHPGNCPSDSGGCILVGTTLNNACLRNSEKAFQSMMLLLPQNFLVTVN